MKPKYRVDHTGSKIGPVTILGFSHRSLNGAMWFAKCDCGKDRQVCSAYFTVLKTKTKCSCSRTKPTQYAERKTSKKGRCRVCNIKLPKTKYFRCDRHTLTDYRDIYSEYACQV